MQKFNNFIPNTKGKIERRPGLKIIRYHPRSLWRRFVSWWRGEPTMISQMITFGDPGFLYVGTDRGLFYLDKDGVLKPVPLAEAV